MKLALSTACDFEYDDIDRMDFDQLIHKIRSRVEGASWGHPTSLASISEEYPQIPGLELMPFTSGITPSSLLNERQELIPVNQPQLTITVGDPQTIPPQICVRVQVPPTQDRMRSTVCCNVTYALLKHLIDEQYPFFLDDAGYELKNEILVGGDGGCVDAGRLGVILSQSGSGQY